MLKQTTARFLAGPARSESWSGQGVLSERPRRSFRRGQASHRASLRFARILLVVAGTLWGLWYIGMELVGWGEPGSAAYQRYELYNRLLVLVLGALVAATYAAHRHLRHRYARTGHAGVHMIALGLMVMGLGSGLEFWVFTFAPYAPGSLRGFGWGTYCVGLLLYYIGSAVLGLVLLRIPSLRLPGMLMLAWLPAGALSVALDPLLSTGRIGVAVAVAVCGAAYVLLGLRLSTAGPANTDPLPG